MHINNFEKNMLIGIIANITKENVFKVVSSFISKLKKNKLDYILTKSLCEDKGKLKIELFDDFVTDDIEEKEKAEFERLKKKYGTK